MSNISLSPETTQDPAFQAITAMRTLAMDAVQTANSGHPGTPVSLAPVVYTLYQHFMDYDPADPTWWNRDRFVLSAGHASMLLYSIIHLTGIKKLDKNGKPTSEPAVSIDDIKRFRQLHSVAPVTPNTTSAQGSRQPPAHWAMVRPPALAWPWPPNGWAPATTSPATTCSTSAFGPLWVTVA